MQQVILSVTILVTFVAIIREGRGAFNSFQESLKQPLRYPSYRSQESCQAHKPEFLCRLNVGTRHGPMKGLLPHQKPIWAQSTRIFLRSDQEAHHDTESLPPGPARPGLALFPAPGSGHC